MKKNYMIGILTFIMSLTLIFAQEKQVTKNDIAIKWKGYKVTGEHEGYISIADGKLNFKDGFLTGGEFIVDMTSITCADIEDQNYNQKLVGHLKSDDFFGVKTFPTSKIIFKKVNRAKEGYSVEADISIKKATHPVKFEVVTKSSNGKTHYKAKIVIDRSKYDVRYGSSSFFDSLGDKVIYDDFELYVDVKI